MEQSRNVVPVSESSTSFFDDDLVSSKTILFILKLSNESR
jgi:hypothetical protein